MLSTNTADRCDLNKHIKSAEAVPTVAQPPSVSPNLGVSLRMGTRNWPQSRVLRLQKRKFAGVERSTCL